MPDYNPVNPARMKAPKPPILQQGVHHQTPAVKTLHALAHAGTTGPRRRKKKKGAHAHKAKTHKAHKAKAHHKKGKRKARAGKAHLVAGSAAARRHMAQLRAMRGSKKAASAPA